MRRFMIDDRAKGAVVAEGAISAEGIVSWVSTKPAINDELEDFKSQIQHDVASGYSGGRLRRPLEWMELFSNSNE